MNNKFYGLILCQLRRRIKNSKIFLNSSPALFKRFYHSEFDREKYYANKERLRELRKKYGYEERQFEDLTLDKFKSLIKDDETAKKIELILSEYEYEKYTTLRVPSTLSVEEMEFLLKQNEINRQRRISYLYKTEAAQINNLVKKKQHSEEYWSQTMERYSKSDAPRTGIFDNNGKLIYGMWHNTILSKISETSTRRLHNSRLITSALFNQKFILDLDYDDNMEFHEIRLLCKQILYLHTYNKYHSEYPFDVHFCNAKINKPIMQNLPKFIQNYEKSMISFHEKSYLDLFPKNHLIYLSPHAEEPLLKYNCDDIYIVGGIVDKSCKLGLTSSKAKNEGIRVARLPIDEFIMWKSGGKRLCVNHVFQILNDWALTGDIKYSLKKNIPQRKQKDEQEVAEILAKRMERYKKQEQMLNKYKRIFKNNDLKTKKINIDINEL